MMSIEIKIANWIKQNIVIIAGIVITILSVCIRVSLFPMVSYDAQYFLLPWYSDIDALGGISALVQQVGNYNVTYQFVIALCTYLPLEPLVAYKVVSCVFDYILAILVGNTIYVMSDTDAKQKGFWGYVIVCLSPIVFLNSSCWAQCDSIYVSFCVLTLLFMYKEKYNMMLLFYGCALALKLQAIFLFPFLILYYLIQRRFSIIRFAIIPIIFLIGCIPAIIQGRSIKDILWIYKGQVGGSACLTYNYPNIWCFITETFVEDYYSELKTMGILLAICLLGILLVVLMNNVQKIEHTDVIYIAMITVAVCILFLPAMHERYGYLVEILSIILAFFVPKTWVLSLALHGITLIMYANYLFEYPANNMRLYATINLVVIFIYIIYFFKKRVPEIN